jgi:hypothetical protein
LVDLWCTVRVWLEGPDESSRQRARGPAPGRKFKVTVRFRGPPELKESVQSLADIFSDRSRRFPINRGVGGFGTFFSELFFFFAIFGGGEWGGGEGQPETRGTSCAIPSWNVPKSIFWGRRNGKSVTKSRSRRKSVTKFLYI